MSSEGNFELPVNEANTPNDLTQEKSLDTPEKSSNKKSRTRPSDDAIKSLQLTSKETPALKLSTIDKDKVKSTIKSQKSSTSPVKISMPMIYGRDVKLSEGLSGKIELPNYPKGALNEEEAYHQLRILNEAELNECKALTRHLEFTTRVLEGIESKIHWEEWRSIWKRAKQEEKKELLDAINTTAQNIRMNNERQEELKKERIEIENEHRRERIELIRSEKCRRKTAEKQRNIEDLERSARVLDKNEEVRNDFKEKVKVEKHAKRLDFLETNAVVRQQRIDEKIAEKREREYDYSSETKYKLRQAWMKQSEVLKRIEGLKKCGLGVGYII